jgi:hypothetical protein
MCLQMPSGDDKGLNTSDICNPNSILYERWTIHTFNNTCTLILKHLNVISRISWQPFESPLISAPSSVKELSASLSLTPHFPPPYYFLPTFSSLSLIPPPIVYIFFSSFFHCLFLTLYFVYIFLPVLFMIAQSV